jgi:hypothetical protein
MQLPRGIIIGMRLARGLPVFVLFAIAVVTAAQNVEPVPPEQREIEGTEQLIGILPEVAELQKLSANATPADRWEILWLHQRISERVTAASLRVDATIAQIDNEVTRANELRGYLSDRRDLTVSRANLLGVIVAGGLSATGSAMQFSDSTVRVGNAISLGGGVLSVGLGLIGIHAQNGGTSRFDFNSNMLAEFFDRPILPDSHYPPIIWTFLGQQSRYGPPGVSRRQQLLQNWVQVKRIDSLANADKIDRLTSQPSEALKLSIDDLEDRAAMLEDVRARISFLKRDLAALLASLPDAPSSLGGLVPASAP